MVSPQPKPPFVAAAVAPARPQTPVSILTELIFNETEGKKCSFSIFVDKDREAKYVGGYDDKKGELPITRLVDFKLLTEKDLTKLPPGSYFIKFDPPFAAKTTTFTIAERGTIIITPTSDKKASTSVIPSISESAPQSLSLGATLEKAVRKFLSMNALGEYYFSYKDKEFCHESKMSRMLTTSHLEAIMDFKFPISITIKNAAWGSEPQEYNILNINGDLEKRPGTPQASQTTSPKNKQPSQPKSVWDVINLALNDFGIKHLDDNNKYEYLCDGKELASAQDKLAQETDNIQQLINTHKITIIQSDASGQRKQRKEYVVDAKGELTEIPAVRSSLSAVDLSTFPVVVFSQAGATPPPQVEKKFSAAQAVVDKAATGSSDSTVAESTTFSATAPDKKVTTPSLISRPKMQERSLKEVLISVVQKLKSRGYGIECRLSFQDDEFFNGYAFVGWSNFYTCAAKAVYFNFPIPITITNVKWSPQVQEYNIINIDGDLEKCPVKPKVADTSQREATAPVDEKKVAVDPKKIFEDIQKSMKTMETIARKQSIAPEQSIAREELSAPSKAQSPREQLIEAQSTLKQNISQAFKNSLIEQPLFYSADLNYYIASTLNSELKEKDPDKKVETILTHLVYNATNLNFQGDDRERAKKLLVRIYDSFFPDGENKPEIDAELFTQVKHIHRIMNILKAEAIVPRLEQYVQSVDHEIETGAVYGGTAGKIFGSFSSAVPLQEKKKAANKILSMYQTYLQAAPNPAKSAEELVEYITIGVGKKACASGVLKSIADDVLKQLPQKDAAKPSPSLSLK